MSNFTWQFGERVRWVRKSNNLTQEEFGEILGVSRQTINAYENDRQRPPLDKLEKISREQNISPYWILTGQGSPKLDSSYLYAEESGVPPVGVTEDSLSPEQRALINFITEDRGRAARLTRFLMDSALKNRSVTDEDTGLLDNQ